MPKPSTTEFVPRFWVLAGTHNPTEILVHKRENKSKQFLTNSFIKANAERKRLQEMSLKEKDYKKNRERKGIKRREKYTKKTYKEMDTWRDKV